MTGWRPPKDFAEATARLAYLEGFARGSHLRMEALEKRVYKLEDVVNEILRRAGIGKRVEKRPIDADGGHGEASP